MEKFQKSYYDPDPIVKEIFSRVPPIRRLWNVYGVNLPTEVSFFVKEKNQQPRFDKSGDRFSRTNPAVNIKDFLRSIIFFSGNKLLHLNPNGLEIVGGIAYETESTLQSITRTCVSGDGTVPYSSLAYPRVWEKEAETQGIEFDVIFKEIEGAEHREILRNEECFSAIIDLVCQKK
jgi:hypothetical protein